MDRTYRIFTDGSAIGNPGPGGWGAVLIEGNKRWEMSGARPWTTISEMELLAPLQALRSLTGRGRIELYSDSEYVIYGMRAFVFHWQRHGWRNRRGTRVAAPQTVGGARRAERAVSHSLDVDQRAQRASGTEPRRHAGLSGCPHSLGRGEGGSLTLAETLTSSQKENH